MKLEDIQALWDKDSHIEQTNLTEESLKTAKLHQRYLDILTHEKLILRKLESDLKVLKFQKREFYLQGHDEETRKKGWEFPAKGMITKAEVPIYYDGDKEITELTLKVNLQQEKVEYLVSIIQTLRYRNMDIRNAIEFLKFTNGA